MWPMARTKPTNAGEQTLSAVWVWTTRPRRRAPDSESDSILMQREAPRTWTDDRHPSARHSPGILRRLTAILLAIAAAGCVHEHMVSGDEARTHPKEKRMRGPQPSDPLPQAILQSARVIVLDRGEVARSGSGVILSSRPQEAGRGTNASGDERPLGWHNILVTNAHVVAPTSAEESLRYRVILEGSAPNSPTNEIEARVIALGEVPAMDLALLAFDGPRLSSATLAASEELTIGADLFAIAAPYGRELSASAGILSRIDYEAGPDQKVSAAMLKTDAAIGYGASGGGLFSRRSGHLIGIIEGYRTAKLTIPINGELYAFDIPMPGETFAAPVEKLIRFARENGFSDIIQKAP